MLGRGLRIVLSFLVAALFLFLFFRNLDLREVASHARRASPGWLVIAVAMQGGHLWLRCLRWRLLLSPLKPRIGFYNLFSTTAIGYLVTMVFPLRLGEVLRPVMLGRREGIIKSGAVATCVLERLMDAMSVAFLLGVYLIFFLDPSATSGSMQMQQVRRAGLLLGAAMLAAFPALYLLAHHRETIFRWLEGRTSRPSAMLPRLVHGFLSGFDAVKGGRLFTVAWAQSVAIWLVITASIWASLRSLGLPLGFADSLLMMALFTIGIAVPTQGGVGTFEYAGKFGLVTFFEVEPNRAAAAVLVTHVFAVTPVILVGLAFLWREGLSLRSVSS